MNSIQSNFKSEMIVEAIILIFSGAIGYLITKILRIDPDLQTLIVGILILISVFLIRFFQRGVKNISDELGKKFMVEKTGIMETFPDLYSCKEEMQNDFKQANEIKMLLQIGRRELGDSEPSFFYKLAKEKVNPDEKIRVLRASENSPFLSEKRAKNRKTSSYKRWIENLRRLKKEIEILREAGSKIEDREHKEPFLWRIFIFDKSAYVSAYLFKQDNEKKANVYKIQDGEHSLFGVFNKYFEYLWRKYDAESDVDTIWETWE